MQAKKVNPAAEALTRNSKSKKIYDQVNSISIQDILYILENAPKPKFLGPKPCIGYLGSDGYV